MQPVLLDSSVYIAALRQGETALIAIRNMAYGAPLWLSAVVLEDLYAGSRRKAIRIVDRLDRDFNKVTRILVPLLDDGRQTGLVLSRLAQKYGYELIGRARLTNDALIAMSASRKGIKVITANERDFSRLATIRPFQWEVIDLDSGFKA